MTRPVAQGLTLGAGIRATAARCPGKIAIRCGARDTDYATLVAQADQIGTWLARDHGIGPGDRVALVAANCGEYITLLLAIADLGAAAVLVNPRLTSREIAAILDDSDPRLVIAQHDPALPPGASAPSRPLLAIGAVMDRAAAAAVPGRIARAQEHRPFALHYTSGTTGLPKGVPISHRSRVLSFLGMASEYGCYGPDDHFLAVAPLCHGAGLAFALAPLYTGGTVTLLDQFDPARVAWHLAHDAVTGLFLVPTHFRRIFDLPQRDLDGLGANRLRALISNAAPLPQADKERIIDLFGEGRLFECYGATESGIITNLRPAFHRVKHNCVGTPFVATEVELRGPDGSGVADGEVGELFSRSPYLFDGYWQRPAESAEAIHDGWVSVGDLARRDGDGFYYIVDRKKDMIISGGLNIYSREVEAVILDYRGIDEVAVVGLPDPEWGEIVHAEIVSGRGAALLDDGFRAFLRQNLAGYKTPRSLSVCGALPKNSNGKVLKTQIRQRLLEPDSLPAGHPRPSPA